MPASRTPTPRKASSALVSPYSKHKVDSFTFLDDIISIASTEGDGDDAGSEFQPDSPTPGGKAGKEERYLEYAIGGVGSDTDMDIKPYVDDDSISSSDEKPKIKSKSKATPTKKRGGGGGSGKKPPSAWSAEEDWRMFQILHPKVDKPSWATIAAHVGRDSKSCQNRYAIMGKKLEAAIKAISGPP